MSSQESLAAEMQTAMKSLLELYDTFPNDERLAIASNVEQFNVALKYSEDLAMELAMSMLLDPSKSIRQAFKQTVSTLNANPTALLINNNIAAFARVLRLVDQAKELGTDSTTHPASLPQVIKRKDSPELAELIAKNDAFMDQQLLAQGITSLDELIQKNNKLRDRSEGR